jgi:hypothetical protein
VPVRYLCAVSHGYLAGAVFFIGLWTVVQIGCSQGQGSGSATGTLDVPRCWSGPFDLKPDFFGAVPATGNSLLIRVQNGGDYESFSDGLAIVVDDIAAIRGGTSSGGASNPGLLGQTLVVGLPPGVTAPGVPIMAVANPPIVHATLYLNRTCRTQNLALYATDRCQIVAAGSASSGCASPAVISSEGGTGGGLTEGGGAVADSSLEASTVPVTPDASPVSSAVDGGIAEGGPPAIGMSTIVFHSLFDGNPSESNDQARLTWADFDFFFADPREACAGGLGGPPPCRGHLSGYFRFYFERGRPAQPFP